MDHFLDTSWTLHHPTNPSPSYQKLFKSNPSTTQAQLDRTFSRLLEYLRSQTLDLKDDLDDSASKLGVLRECTSTLHSLVTRESPSITDTEKTYILIRLIYTTSTFTLILYTSNLILIKAPATLSKHTLSFLSDTFSISPVPLKLPSTLLSQILETYISTLKSPSISNTNDLSGLETETRASMLKTALGTLRLSISFPGPVSPHLRTLDLSVPYETVEALLSSSTGTTNQTQTFTYTLAHHLHLQTGLKLPLGTSPNSVDEDEAEQDEKTMTNQPRVSKIACAAFAISVEGRLRFAAKAVEGAGSREDVVVSVNLGVLSGIVHAVRGWAGIEG